MLRELSLSTPTNVAVVLRSISLITFPIYPAIYFAVCCSDLVDHDNQNNKGILGTTTMKLMMLEPLVSVQQSVINTHGFIWSLIRQITCWRSWSLVPFNKTSLNLWRDGPVIVGTQSLAIADRSTKTTRISPTSIKLRITKRWYNSSWTRD